jgi:ABC-type transport system involved in cytochrome bd biosynthesis fused ATPase/permease subunit
MTLSSDTASVDLPLPVLPIIARVTFVAQDPVLFPGSIRLNLDPIGEYSDAECADVLKRICSRHGWSLETHVEAGGRNLSQAGSRANFHGQLRRSLRLE